MLSQTCTGSQQFVHIRITGKAYPGLVLSQVNGADVGGLSEGEAQEVLRGCGGEGATTLRFRDMELTQALEPGSGRSDVAG